jgi:hypothetical protein
MFLSSSDKDFGTAWIFMWMGLSAGLDVVKDGKISWTEGNGTPNMQIMVSHIFIWAIKRSSTLTKKIIPWRFQSSESCPLSELNIETYISENPAGINFRVVLENQARISPEILYPCHNMYNAVPRIPQYPPSPLFKPRNWPIRRSTSLIIHAVYVS